jgi:copper chaperone
MLAYRIEDMTCGGCVRAIRAAVARVAPTATVEADVAARRVHIDGSDDAAGIRAAIAAAGFDVVPLEPAAAGTSAARGGGCGSGGCRCSG